MLAFKFQHLGTAFSLLPSSHRCHLCGNCCSHHSYHHCHLSAVIPSPPSSYYLPLSIIKPLLVCQLPPLYCHCYHCSTITQCSAIVVLPIGCRLVVALVVWCHHHHAIIMHLMHIISPSAPLLIPVIGHYRFINVIRYRWSVAATAIHRLLLLSLSCYRHSTIVVARLLLVPPTIISYIVIVLL